MTREETIREGWDRMLASVASSGLLEGANVEPCDLVIRDGLAIDNSDENMSAGYHHLHEPRPYVVAYVGDARESMIEVLAACDYGIHVGCPHYGVPALERLVQAYLGNETGRRYVNNFTLGRLLILGMPTDKSGPFLRMHVVATVALRDSLPEVEGTEAALAGIRSLVTGDHRHSDGCACPACDKRRFALAKFTFMREILRESGAWDFQSNEVEP